MAQLYSFLELRQRFQSMEVKHKLFEKTTEDGIRFWDILRYHAYMVVLSRHGIYKDFNLYMHQPRQGKLVRILKIIRLLPIYFLNELQLFFFLPKQTKYCFLMISRFEDQAGNPVDLLMDDIYKQLKGQAFILEDFRHKRFNWLRRNIRGRYFLYPLEISYLIGTPIKDNWQHLSDILNREFALNEEWQYIFENRMELYRKRYAFFRKLLKKVKPQFLFFQSSPKGMIAAANELGITTVDVQHGHTNNTGVYYSYPKEVDLSDLATIPKIFLTQGRFWNDLIDFPNMTIASGGTYFYVDFDENAHLKNGILVVSTAFIHPFLKEQTRNLALNHPDKQFYYKLHSNQYHQKREAENFFGSLKNVSVVYTEKDVKQIMEDCFAVVLIQSTVAYQALQKGLKVFVFKEDYYEASCDIFHYPNVVQVNTWQELSDYLNIEMTVPVNERPVFFEPYDPSVIEEICSKVSPSIKSKREVNFLML